MTYGPGAEAFAGATYDPTSHYRAAAVFAFHASEGLTAERLRAISVHQVGLLEAGFLALDIDPARAHIAPIPEGRRAGFVAIRMPDAARVAQALHERSMFVDARGDILRVGPAPYLSDDQLRSAVANLAEVLA